mgnify:CR=1 FL=1
MRVCGCALSRVFFFCICLYFYPSPFIRLNKHGCRRKIGTYSLNDTHFQLEKCRASLFVCLFVGDRFRFSRQIMSREGSLRVLNTCEQKMIFVNFFFFARECVRACVSDSSKRVFMLGILFFYQVINTTIIIIIIFISSLPLLIILIVN